MGIKNLFAWVCGQYPECVGETDDRVADCIAIDMNGIVHGVASYLHGYGSHSTPALPNATDADIATAVVAELEFLRGISNGNPYWVLCFDGIVPASKMYQQRQRRFLRSSATHDDHHWITRGDGVQSADRPALTFNPNLISPCTDLMHLVAERVRDWAETQRVSYTLSPTHEIGEGEIKLMAKIQTWISDQSHPHIALHGLDADIFVMVCTILHARPDATCTMWRPSIGNSRVLEYLYIDKLWSLLPCRHPASWILACCCCGTDFVPKLAGVHIGRDGGNFWDILETVASLEGNDSECDGDGDGDGDGGCNPDLLQRQLRAVVALIQDEETSYLRRVFSSPANFIAKRLPDDTETLARRYIRTLLWTVEYWTRFQVPDWRSVFPYQDPPLAIHLLPLLDTERQPSPRILHPERHRIPTLPEQYVSIFPADTLATLLPAPVLPAILLAIQSLPHLFPDPVPIDRAGKRYDSELVPRIPPMDEHTATRLASLLVNKQP